MVAMTATSTAALLLLRQFPRRRFRIPCIATSYCHFECQCHTLSGPPECSVSGKEPRAPSTLRPSPNLWEEQQDYRKWKDKEALILKDVEPTIALAKEILHSARYRDGEQLSDEDQRVVIEKILAYHPHSEDKIGCGLYSVMVDRHPEFRNSRCLFVVRTDGGWIDFSYQKCLRAYIREKYPSDAERFIKEHFKRT